MVTEQNSFFLPGPEMVNYAPPAESGGGVDYSFDAYHALDHTLETRALRRGAAGEGRGGVFVSRADRRVAAGEEVFEDYDSPSD
eukprot:7379248-Prymnesium_polylepis.1